jgi:hypothetical protein
MTCALMVAIGLGTLQSIASAQTVTFYGTDANVNGSNLSALVNSNAAASSFLSSIHVTGSENFSSFTPGLNVLDSPFQVGSGDLDPASATVTGVNALPQIWTVANTNNPAGQGFTTDPTSANFLHITGASGDTTDTLLTFTQPVSAFGTYVTGLGNFGGSIDLQYNDGSTNSFTVAGSNTGGAEFFGFTDGAPITAVDLHSVNQPGEQDGFGIDNLTWGNSVAPAPEPSSLPSLLLGGACVLCLALSRKARRVAR